MNRCGPMMLALILCYNLCIRGFQLWLYWQGLTSLWSFGLGGWLLGVIFATVYFMIGNCIEGLIIPLPSELEAPGARRG